MALQPVRFDFDAARRAWSPDTTIDVAFRFFGEEYHLATEPLLGDVLDLDDAPEHAVGINDLATVRTVKRYIRSMLVEDDKLRWDDAVRRLPSSQCGALVELLEWITEQVTGFPTLPPADSSVGRPPTGPSSTPPPAGPPA